MYDLQDVGTFGLMMLFTSLYQSFGLLKLDSRVWIAENENDSKEAMSSALTLGLISSSLFSTTTFWLFICDYTNNDIANFIGYALLNLSIGVANVMTSYYIKVKSLRVIGVSGLLKIVFSGLIQIGVGYFHTNSEILILGAFIGQFCAIGYMYFVSKTWKISSIRQLRKTLKDNYAFSKYATAEGLFNSLGGLVPGILIGEFYGSKAIALYYVTERLLSIGNLVFTENLRIYLSSEFRKRDDATWIEREIRKSYLYIFSLGGICVFLNAFFGKTLVVVFLGENYAEISKFLSFVVIGWIFRIINIPLYVLLQLRMKQKYLATWSAFKFIFTSCVSIGFVYFLNFINFMLVLNIVYVLLGIAFVKLSKSFGKKSR